MKRETEATFYWTLNVFCKIPYCSILLLNHQPWCFTSPMTVSTKKTQPKSTSFVPTLLGHSFFGVTTSSHLNSCCHINFFGFKSFVLSKWRFATWRLLRPFNFWMIYILSCIIHPHRIHEWYIFTYIWFIFMVNVGKYIPYMDPMGFHIPGKHRDVPFFWATGLLFFWGKVNRKQVARCLFLGRWGSEFSAFEHTTLCWVQGGPLPVLNGLITPLNGLINGSLGYNSILSGVITLPENW